MLSWEAHSFLAQQKIYQKDNSLLFQHNLECQRVLASINFKNQLKGRQEEAWVLSMVPTQCCPTGPNLQIQSRAKVSFSQQCQPNLSNKQFKRTLQPSHVAFRISALSLVPPNNSSSSHRLRNPSHLNNPKFRSSKT